MENHHFEWEDSLEIVVFNSYVKIPEGTKMSRWMSLRTFDEAKNWDKDRYFEERGNGNKRLLLSVCLSKGPLKSNSS